jgi:hypothetical protein
MKKMRIGFLALVAIAAMSFTLVSNSDKSAKRANIENCYKPGTFKFLSVGAPTCTWTDITCLNQDDAVGKPIQLSTFSGTYQDPVLSCEGSSVICCVSFTSQVADPTTCTGELRGNGTLRDLDNAVIATGNYITVSQVECKDN